MIVFVGLGCTSYLYGDKKTPRKGRFLLVLAAVFFVALAALFVFREAGADIDRPATRTREDQRESDTKEAKRSETFHHIPAMSTKEGHSHHDSDQRSKHACSDTEQNGDTTNKLNERGGVGHEDRGRNAEIRHHAAEHVHPTEELGGSGGNHDKTNQNTENQGADGDAVLCAPGVTR